jgi:hypothetical protein
VPVAQVEKDQPDHRAQVHARTARAQRELLSGDGEGVAFQAVADGVTDGIGLAQDAGRGDGQKSCHDCDGSQGNEPGGQFLSGEEQAILHGLIIK